MIFKRDWAAEFAATCARVPTAHRRSFSNGELIYLQPPEDRCFVIVSGYVKLVDLQPNGSQTIRLILGRGSLFGTRAFGKSAFGGFAPASQEQAIGHGPLQLIEIHVESLRTAAKEDSELSQLLIDTATVTAQFYERRLQWQQTSPVRARIAATLRDLICYEGSRCRHGHTIDVRLTHQDLSELIGVARPVLSAELSQLKREGFIEYTRSYFCVDNLTGLERVAEGKS